MFVHMFVYMHRCKLTLTSGSTKNGVVGAPESTREFTFKYWSISVLTVAQRERGGTERTFSLLYGRRTCETKTSHVKLLKFRAFKLTDISGKFANSCLFVLWYIGKHVNKNGKFLLTRNLHNYQLFDQLQQNSLGRCRKQPTPTHRDVPRAGTATTVWKTY